MAIDVHNKDVAHELVLKERLRELGLFAYLRNAWNLC